MCPADRMVAPAAHCRLAAFARFSDFGSPVAAGPVVGFGSVLEPGVPDGAGVG